MPNIPNSCSGSVDISVYAHEDTVIQSYDNSKTIEPGIRMISYKIVSLDDSEIYQNTHELMKKEIFEDVLPTKDFVDIIYSSKLHESHDAGNDTNFPNKRHVYYYTVTNNKREDGALKGLSKEGCWKTNQKKPAVKGSDDEIAVVNSEARFPDGLLKIMVNATSDITDLVGSGEKIVVVDNFKPFISGVRIERFNTVTLDYEVQYDNQWEIVNDNHGKPLFLRMKNPAFMDFQGNGPPKSAPGEFRITIHFSEMMDDSLTHCVSACLLNDCESEPFADCESEQALAFSADPSYAAADEDSQQGWSETDSATDTWHGVATIGTRAEPVGSDCAWYELRISGFTDRAGNKLEMMYPRSPDIPGGMENMRDRQVS